MNNAARYAIIKKKEKTPPKQQHSSSVRTPKCLVTLIRYAIMWSPHPNAQSFARGAFHTCGSKYSFMCLWVFCLWFAPVENSQKYMVLYTQIYGHIKYKIYVYIKSTNQRTAHIQHLYCNFSSGAKIRAHNFWAGQAWRAWPQRGSFYFRTQVTHR